jgi:hypothetical protein
MSLSRFKLILLLGSAAAVAAPLSATQALAASSHAVPATQSARIQAEIKAQLRYNPSGTVINPSQISYDHGHVIVTVAGPDIIATVCPAGDVCLYDGETLEGDIAAINGPLDKNITIRAFLPRVQSLWNRRAHGSILSNNSSAVCYRSGQTANRISTPYSNYPYLFLEANSNC